MKRLMWHLFELVCIYENGPRIQCIKVTQESLLCMFKDGYPFVEYKGDRIWETFHAITGCPPVHLHMVRESIYESQSFDRQPKMVAALRVIPGSHFSSIPYKIMKTFNLFIRRYIGEE